MNWLATEMVLWLVRCPSLFSGFLKVCFSFLPDLLFFSGKDPLDPLVVRLARGQTFLTRPSNWSYVQNQHKQVVFGTKKFLHFANL